MFGLRRAKLSAWYELKLFFESPTVWDGTPFTVYGREEMDDAVSSLTRPFVFLLSSRVMFETRHLPVVVIETMFSLADFEMGNDKGICQLELHVFGRSEAERDDIAGAIIANVNAIRIRDFTTGGYPVLSTEQIEAGGGGYWTILQPDISTDVAIEGTLAQWNLLRTGFWVDIV